MQPEIAPEPADARGHASREVERTTIGESYYE